MTNLEKARTDAGLSQRKLGELAKVSHSDICKAERRGLRLYAAQAERVARVLGWEGSPDGLFEEAAE